MKGSKVPFREHFTKDGKPKRGYKSYSSAFNVMEKMENAADLHIYYCSICGQYHIGHLTVMQRLIRAEDELKMYRENDLGEQIKALEIEKKKQADLILELRMKLGNDIREAAAERIDKYKIQIKDLEKSVKSLKQTRDSLLYRLSKFDNPEPLNLDALKTEPEPEETAKLRRGSIVKVHSTGILKEVDSIGENGEVLFLGLGNTLVEITRTDFKRLKY